MTINRRHLLYLLLSATTGIATIVNKKHKPTKNISWAQTKPQIYKSENGLLEVELTAQETPVNIGDKTVYLLTYNGQIPAPQLEAKAGDKVKITLTNKLNKSTNLHYHGLHISPQGKADNVFVEIQPNQTYNYEFTIPEDHQSITGWYHPHLHGNTAEQLSGGLAGLFVVRGKLEEISTIKSAKEEFIVLQDFALDNDGKLMDSRMMSLMTGREGDLITVNGKVNPQINCNKGEWLRLRILNASTSRFYNLSLENNPFFLIATDGGAINSPQQMNSVLLTPGQRVEIMIQGDSQLSSLKMINLPYNRGAMGMMGGGMMGRRNNNNSSETLATINFVESNNNIEPLSLPNQLNSINPLPSPTQTRSFTLNHGMANGMAFLINGKAYNHQRIDTTVNLDTVEEWELINTGIMDHPFHIHVNSFQVVSRDDIPEKLLAWRDTVLVKRGERVKIRIPFQNFVGKTVYHCHILDHEDLGMMGNLEIIS
ncbi:multicopper oxidase family protein [Cyanobacterium stanieri LEGE 03274]|uniref:Multicopper oxidase family protein n=1 Tax=Cyanobacterium stanieri LEGE 03274 TaxID=1828756 RepID=A0ABR9V6E3_9CHRO|nr:multicopper oxidase family protein [Cyanobacterium stanieri]MBE9223454.1 multicopper oxidase family protein [Cyanobacterium stanieri LEGE 03274]